MGVLRRPHCFDPVDLETIDRVLRGNLGRDLHGCSLAHKCSNFDAELSALGVRRRMLLGSMLHRLEFVVCFLLLFNAVLFLVGFLLTQVRFL